MDPFKAASQFSVSGRLSAVRPLGSGNVNDTYIAVFEDSSATTEVIVQKISSRVFKKPRWIIENMRTLSDHARKRKKKASIQIPNLINAVNGKDYFIDETGEMWRALTLIDGARSFDTAQSADHAFEAGSVLAQFHALVSDMDVASLRDTLPGFHVTPEYLKAYDAAARQPKAKISSASAAEAKRLHAFIEARRASAAVLEEARDAGILKTRPIHGDPKVGNIMIDGRTGKGTGIVDLDTLKPGLLHYDFGDAIRSICNAAGEETPNLDSVRFDISLCEAFIRGYMKSAKDFLTAGDRRFLYASIRLIAFELGLRFFQDFLAGDVYFKTSRPDQNLHRARIQFRLCESIESQEEAIQNIVS